MNISVPSRFACLKLEDEEFKPANTNRKVGEKKKDKTSVKKTGKDSKKGASNKLMNGVAKKDKKVKQQSEKQWEEWKEKDSQLVHGSYEQDLESAILLSKLHFEENKELFNKYKKETEEANKKVEKKKKAKVMSLDQFLAANTNKTVISTANVDIKTEDNFFEMLESDAKNELNKEEVIEKRKQRDEKREATIEEIITSSQYQEKLEIEKKKNCDLQKELDKAREEVVNVKSRNQTLCTMLGTGEMKDKADVLSELERLNIIKNDLTDEVTRLHGLLEQERSKVASLMSDSKHKDKRYKKHA